MAQRWMFAVVGVLSVVLMAGCGGGDDSTTTVTKVEFTKQANSICADGEKTRQAAVADYNKQVKAQTSGNADRKLERELADEMVKKSVVPSLQEQLGELEGLGTPAADEDQVSRMLKSLSQAVDELEKKGVQGLVEGEKLVKFQEEAKGYGLNCAF